MNAQLRELLLRIPASPETDELQNVLEKQDKLQRAELTELRREKLVITNALKTIRFTAVDADIRQLADEAIA